MGGRKRSRTARCPKCGEGLYSQYKLASKIGILGRERTITKKGRPLYRRVWWCSRCKKDIKVPLYSKPK